MKYVFENGIDLCGWQKLPFAIRDRRGKRKARISWLNEHAFDILNLCDGKTDFDIPFFTDDDRKMLEEGMKNGILKECTDEKDEKKVNYTYYDNRYIRTVHWSITGRCNAKCKHCYMSAPDAKYGEMSHEEIFKIIDEIADAGVSSVTLTGGECLVRSDFLEIVDRLIEKNIHIDTIYTNGFLVTDKLLKAIKDKGILPEFNMSFDGVGYHDWMRGIDGAEKMTSDAFKLCHEYGFPTGCEMVLFKKNLHTIRDTVNYLSKLGVRSIKIVQVCESEFWKKYGEKEKLTIKEIYDTYLEYIPHYYEDGKPMNLMLGGFFMAYSQKDDCFIPSYKKVKNLDTTCVCNHARLIMYLSAEGRVLPCMSLSSLEVQKDFPLIQDLGLSKCLSDSYYMEFIDKTATDIINLNPKCMECEYKNNCYGGCRASALESQNGIYGIDDYACALFKEGYIDKIKEAVNKAEPKAKLVL